VKIELVTPVAPQSRQGNRTTALRWARLLRSLGHRVKISQEFKGQSCDLLIALHARRSFVSIARFRDMYPTLPLIVALTGTDLYGDIHTDPEAQQSLQLASRLIVLQPKGIDEVPEGLRAKTRVIFQSAAGLKTPSMKSKTTFDVCVLAHLRSVKDPLRAAMAARFLPSSSRIRILQIGKALNDDMAERAQAEAMVNPRYQWLGELPRWQARRVLARSHVMVLSSILEGGANAVSEALAVSVPILASKISGSIGLLGEDYPGYFPVADTLALKQLLQRVETDVNFYKRLTDWTVRLTPLVEPAREQQAWKALLQDLCL